MNLGMTRNEYLPAPVMQSPPTAPPAVQQLNERERMVQSLAKEHKGQSRAALQSFLGKDLGAEVADTIQSQMPTLKQILGKRQQQRREADAECGKALATAGIQVQQHSVKDYTHVIVTQLDLLQGGSIPSISAAVNAAYPNDPKKATSIKNSQHGKRRKQAWDSLAVMNHPLEKAMQVTHGRDSMNRRHSARTFGQSLGINRAMFKSCDRITKLEARVQLLEQKMQITKNREALADAGATTSEEKVFALYRQGKMQTEIAKLLDMKVDAVKYHLKKLPKRA